MIPLVLTFVGDDRPGLVNAIPERIAACGATRPRAKAAGGAEPVNAVAPGRERGVRRIASHRERRQPKLIDKFLTFRKCGLMIWSPERWFLPPWPLRSPVRWQRER